MLECVFFTPSDNVLRSEKTAAGITPDYHQPGEGLVRYTRYTQGKEHLTEFWISWGNGIIPRAGDLGIAGITVRETAT